MRGGHDMGLLRLAGLGSPEIFHDGRRLPFALRKAQALLLYVAVEGGMHQRRKVAAFLWPDSTPHDARTALRNALTLLRSLLANPDAAASAHLLSEGELLGLDPQAPLELDLAVVQQAYTQTQRFSTPPSELQRAALVAQCQQALALVRGPFLDGFWLREGTGFDAWRGQPPTHRCRSRSRGARAAQCTGDSAGGPGRRFPPPRRELSAGAGWAGAGGAGGGGGRHRQNAAGHRVCGLGPGPGRRSAQRARPRDGGTAALSAAGRGPAALAGGGKRAGGPAGGSVADRTGAPAAGTARALP